jgi:hypothetical protein
LEIPDAAFREAKSDAVVTTDRLGDRSLGPVRLDR